MRATTGCLTPRPPRRHRPADLQIGRTILPHLTPPMLTPLRLPPLLAASLALAACGTVETEPVASGAPAAFVADSFADSVALAHGYAAWSDVRRVDFDFVVEVNDTPRVDRGWTWYPRRDSVVLSAGDGLLSFVRGGDLDSAALEADGQFINDSYWVMMPFYLVWSEGGYSPTVTRGVTAPLSGAPATMLTVAYGAEGGYTPGDAYDLYVDADHRLTEWVFRRGGGEEATMTTAWTGYRDVEGLLLPTDHPGEGPVRIRHRDLSAVMDAD